ncbi:pisatin demethylase [Apodospora peruviana]|uniref:Pisatin demethylase n=1 Tax=Apodospora peruviana TaxID=516989 RepID=A0AAE0HWV9_9PEZI|nr:pisatin demethylase [Apodospora peruviana]
MGAITEVALTHVRKIGLGLARLIPVALVLLLALYLIVSTLRQYCRLRHIPGPFWSAISKWWLAWSETQGNLYLDVYKVTQRYGPIARIGPNELVTSDPYLIKHMTNVRSGYQRSEYFYGMRFDPTKDNVLSTRDDNAHTKLRTKMAMGYSGKEVDNLEPIIDRNILALIHLLETQYILPGKPFDFARKAQFFTLDAISDISYGKPFGFLANDTDLYSYIATIEEQLPTIMLTTVYPWIVDVLSSPLFKRLLPSDKDLIGLGRIRGIVKGIVAERFGPDPKTQKRDMLGSFVRHGLTQEEAESEVIMQILAGSDTTATAIRSTILRIITNPLVFSRIHTELASAGISATNPPPSEVISDHDSRTKLPYIQAVIKEGLRIHPPVAGLTSKSVPKGGDTWKGVYLPEGAKVGFGAFGVMRNRQAFGDDADEFRPERWLNSTTEKLKEMEMTLDLAFSNGRWQCLGRNVALMELNKVFVEILRRFDLVVLDPTRPMKTANAGIFLQSEFWLRGYKRD